jgi:hypothetical protein
MKFLYKDRTEIDAHLSLNYPQNRIRAIMILMSLQKHFCAYSERYLKNLDSVELEHFDPRKKNKDTDNISNWHAVIRWMNAHKARKIDDYQPLPDLTDWDPARVWYENGKFVCAENDYEAKNLIRFLGVNRIEVYEERAMHIARLKKMRDMVGNDMLLEHLEEFPEQLEFPSAIEADLGIPAFDLICQQG